MKIKNKGTFACPRCGIKCLTGTESCPDCGLVFSRLEIATNKDAKRKIKRHDKDFIIKTTNIPSDVSYVKLLLLTIFVGVFGGHCFYVGRYSRGIMFLINSLLLMSYVIFNKYLVNLDEGRLLAALSTIGGLFLLVWAYDVISVILKKFKIPVAIDVDEKVILGEEEDK